MNFLKPGACAVYATDSLLTVCGIPDWIEQNHHVAFVMKVDRFLRLLATKQHPRRSWHIEPGDRRRLVTTATIKDFNCPNGLTSTEGG